MYQKISVIKLIWPPTQPYPASPFCQAAASQVLELKEEEQTFTFEGVSSEPIPSLLRDLSAPVKLRYDYTDEDLAFLMKHDTDSFNRWEAGQQVG